ncbi:hypothetical protein HY025_03790 [Candidatus Daviesbacteria bacterium]|nr:hypothetical protein [Candidatus Daviesbacteria bacterium]
MNNKQPSIQPKINADTSFETYQSTSNSTQNFGGGFLGPAENFSFISSENIANLNIVFNPTQESKKPLSFATDGENFLTFKRPPESYLREISLKILEQAKEQTFNSQPTFLSTNSSPETQVEVVEIAEIEPQEAPENKEDKGKSVLSSVLKPVSPAFKKAAPGFFKGLGTVAASFFSLFFEDILGFGGSNPKPKDQKTKDKEELERKQNVNKQKFWGELAKISQPLHISPILREQMQVTNQFNGFYEEYEGVVNPVGAITKYHHANRVKKEIESKAARIQAERASKMVSTAKKTPLAAGFATRSGELLMGTENPSHFTKALG